MLCCSWVSDQMTTMVSIGFIIYRLIQQLRLNVSMMKMQGYPSKHWYQHWAEVWAEHCDKSNTTVLYHHLWFLVRVYWKCTLSRASNAQQPGKSKIERGGRISFCNDKTNIACVPCHNPCTNLCLKQVPCSATYTTVCLLQVSCHLWPARQPSARGSVGWGVLGVLNNMGLLPGSKRANRGSSRRTDRQYPSLMGLHISSGPGGMAYAHTKS